MKKMMMASLVMVGCLGVANAAAPTMITLINNTDKNLTLNQDVAMAKATPDGTHIMHQVVPVGSFHQAISPSAIFINVFKSDPSIPTIQGYFPACVLIQDLPVGTTDVTITCSGTDTVTCDQIEVTPSSSVVVQNKC